MVIDFEPQYPIIPDFENEYFEDEYEPDPDEAYEQERDNQFWYDMAEAEDG